MIKKKILKAFKKFSFLSGEDNTINVALSGGADSMALLFALNALKQELGISLRAMHLNHLIRGEEAFRDEAFVKEQCKALGIELVCEQIDVPAKAQLEGLSIELAARKARYSFFERCAGDTFVATAHTASDNLETVLLNLTRGTSLDGLCGIPPKRDKYIRPLILCTREEIEEYCNKNNISFITDSTNLSDDYTRNKLRHAVVPVLKAINPAVESSVGKNSNHLRFDAEFLNDAAKRVFKENIYSNVGLKLSAFDNLGRAVSTRVLKLFAESRLPDVELEATHIDTMYDNCVSKGVSASLPKKYLAVVRRGILYIENSSNEYKNTQFNIEICEQENIFYKNDKKVNNLLLNNLLDCDKIIGKLVKRTRIAGDSIRLLNRGCTKSLNKLFCENGVPVNLRDRIPVLADDVGVVWVYGIGVCERCSVTASSKRVLSVNVIKGEF